MKKHVNKKLLMMVLIVALCMSAFLSSCTFSNDGIAQEKYSDIYYYDETRAERYKDYKDNNPELSEEDVIWMVNVDIDKEDYVDAIETPNFDTETALVNKHFKLPDDYKPTDLEIIDGVVLREATRDALVKMKAAAKKDGYIIFGSSGFREFENQKEYYDRYKAEDGEEAADKYSARPGYSEHQTGYVIDVRRTNEGTLSTFNGTPEAAWVLENCHKYGFIVRYLPENVEITSYMSEPWHLRYIGVEHATAMKEKNINSYEEYWVKYINNTPDGSE